MVGRQRKIRIKVSERALRDLCGEQAAGKLPLLPAWVLGFIVTALAEMKSPQGFPDKKQQALPGRSAPGYILIYFVWHPLYLYTEMSHPVIAFRNDYISFKDI